MIWWVLFVGCGSSQGPLLGAQEPPEAPLSEGIAATVDDLAWLAGTWTADGEPATEETWSAPRGGTLLGINRTVADGATVAFEFLRIEPRGEGLVYVAQPGGGAPTRFALTALQGQEAVFENPAHDFPSRITYRRVGLLLHAAVEGADGRALRWTWQAAGGEEPVVDLTWPFDEDTIYWPTAEPFQLEVVHHGPVAGGWHYEANNYSAAEHGGTHLDAPSHFAEGRWTVDQIPLERLSGPAVVVDIAERAANDPDTELTVADLEAWEQAHGPIPRGAIVLVRSGWGARWPDRLRYLGTDVPGDTENLHFPGIGPDAARWLAEEREIDAVGIDTPSIDRGQSTDFRAHVILYERNIPGLENVAHLERLPPTGAEVHAYPMLIRGGSGAPARIVATGVTSR